MSEVILRKERPMDQLVRRYTNVEASERHPDYSEDSVRDVGNDKLVGTVLCDGMSGKLGDGRNVDVANDTSEWVKNEIERIDTSNNDKVEQQLYAIYDRVHKKVVKKHRKTGDYKLDGIGTTASTMLVYRMQNGEMKFSYANNGDSRIYRFSRSTGNLQLLTVDANKYLTKAATGGRAVGRLRTGTPEHARAREIAVRVSNMDKFSDTKMLPGLEVAYFDKRNEVRGLIGFDEIDMEIATHDVVTGDIFISMSDGYADNISHDNLQRIVIECTSEGKFNNNLFQQKLLAAYNSRPNYRELGTPEEKRELIGKKVDDRSFTVIDTYQGVEVTPVAPHAKLQAPRAAQQRVDGQPATPIAVFMEKQEGIERARDTINKEMGKEQERQLRKLVQMLKDAESLVDCLKALVDAYDSGVRIIPSGHVSKQTDYNILDQIRTVSVSIHAQNRSRLVFVPGLIRNLPFGQIDTETQAATRRILS